MAADEHDHAEPLPLERPNDIAKKYSQHGLIDVEAFYRHAGKVHTDNMRGIGQPQRGESLRLFARQQQAIGAEKESR